MLEVRDITKYFDKGGKQIIALEDISFRVKEGELVGLLGPNGSGKTTLINLILGFYLPDKGDIKLYGESIYKNSKLVQKYIRIPFLLDDPRFTVYETLMLTAKFFRVKNYKEKIEYWLEFFNIEHEKDTQLQKLSTGNLQKIRIIGALISEPKLLLLDEITNGLDLITVANLLEILKSINKKYEVSIMFASHIFTHIEKLCRRVIILYNGKILADDNITTLKKKAQLKEYITIRTKDPLPELLLNKIKDNFTIVRSGNVIYKIVTDDASKELRNFAKFLSENQELDIYIEDIRIKEISLDDIFAYYVSEFKS